jgi:hypothetical protein
MAIPLREHRGLRLMLTTRDVHVRVAAMLLGPAPEQTLTRRLHKNSQLSSETLSATR